MTKNEFLFLLRERLAGLPQDDVEERLCFYGEMIDDRMEEGATEEEAVAAVGSTDEAAQQVLTDIPLSKILRASVRPKRRLSTPEIVLLVLGFPVWFPLLISAAAVVLSLYVSLWAVVVSFWAVFGSLAGCGIGGLLGGVVLVTVGHTLSGLALVAAGLICAGLSILAFFGCRAASKDAVWLGKKLTLWIKRCFVRKGEP